MWATPRFGVVGAWWCLAIYEALMVALLEVRYRFGSWMRVLVEAPVEVPVEVPEGEPRATPTRVQEVGVQAGTASP
jgi:hypothetical protein